MKLLDGFYGCIKIIIKEKNRWSEKNILPIRRILYFMTYDTIRLKLKDANAEISDWEIYESA